VGGYVTPIQQWRTVTQEKETLNEVEADLVIGERDAPTSAFASLVKPLVGTFAQWIDDPTLLAEHLRTATQKYRQPVGFAKRVELYGDVEFSRDYVEAIDAACAWFSASSVNYHSVSVARIDTGVVLSTRKHRANDLLSGGVSVVGTPELRGHRWSIEYLAVAFNHRFRVFTSMTSQYGKLEGGQGTRILDIVELSDPCHVG
jgi:hypothetical protein